MNDSNTDHSTTDHSTTDHSNSSTAQQPGSAKPHPHVEIFTGTAQAGLIFVSCACPIGEDHSYEDGIKYRGPVDANAFR